MHKLVAKKYFVNNFVLVTGSFVFAKAVIFFTFLNINPAVLLNLTANIGALPYISPECRTRSKYNNKTDIWFYLLLLIVN